MVRAFLRPGWIVLGIVVVAFAYMCFTLLAPWQLGKNTSTQHRNDLIKSAMTKSPVPIATVTPAGAAFNPETEWREVSLTGHYLPDKQLLVRLRSVDEQPAIEVLTPFATDDGTRTVLVDRGYVRPTQGAIPTIADAPSGQTTINGRIRAGEGTTPGRGAHTEGGVLAVYSIDPADAGRATGLRLDPFYLQLSPQQPGSLGEIPLPQLDSGPYLSYGLQWLAFGVMAPLGAAYFIYSEIRQRRRADAAAAAAAADPDAPTDTGPAEAPEEQSRRDRVRAELREAGTGTGSRQRFQIGHAPDVEQAPDAVRAKLTDRYGS